MNVTRFNEAPKYFPSQHYQMQCVRLQGHEAGPSDTLWMGVSTLEHGGHTSLAASPLEKHYVVLQGEVVVSTGNDETTLYRYDSCRLAPGESRALRNDSAQAAMILLAMPVSRSTP
jgi:quercetin dioxygenase-like cupin family protein